MGKTGENCVFFLLSFCRREDSLTFLKKQGRIFFYLRFIFYYYLILLFINYYYLILLCGAKIWCSTATESPPDKLINSVTVIVYLEAFY